ncbi:hypothetical protein KSS87_019457, partial [Heliosperma pusillum]
PLPTFLYYLKFLIIITIILFNQSSPYYHININSNLVNKFLPPLLSSHLRTRCILKNESHGVENKV